MRVRLLTGIRYRGSWYSTGMSLDVSAGLGKSLIEGGAAVQAHTTTAPRPAQKERTRANRT